MKKIVIIPDSFKGTMTSHVIGSIIAEEAASCWADAQIVRFEVADGGEGSVDAFLSALQGQKIDVVVQGPYGETIDSFYGLIGETAIVEMAAAAGLPLVGENRQAGQTSTYGVGQLMRHALDRKIRRMILALGGSATNDGGAGAAVALGVRFYNSDGEAFVPVGDTLSQIERIDMSGLDARLAGVQIVAMCDIDNPLCGEKGAAAVFGPQKGASPEQVAVLDAGLAHIADVIERDIGVNVRDIQGAGAAGGMGAGVMAFFGATLQSGIDIVLETVRFDEVLEDASLVITGEGRIDGQSAHGKVIAGIARRAKARNIPVLAIVGDIADDAEKMYDIGVSAIFSINRVAVSYQEAKPRAQQDLRRTVRTIFQFAKLAKSIG